MESTLTFVNIAFDIAAKMLAVTFLVLMIAQMMESFVVGYQRRKRVREEAMQRMTQVLHGLDEINELVGKGAARIKEANDAPKD